MRPATLLTRSNRQRFKECVNFAFAVGKVIEANADFVKQRQVKIRERRRLRELDMTSAFHSARGTASNDDGQVRMIMQIRVSHATAVEEQRMIEQRTAAVLSRFQFRDELSEQRDVKLIDLGHLRDLFGIVAVMGERMMRVGHTD